MRTVVLVHGAWHGPWAWAPVLAGLDERGVAAVPVDLPGGDFAADVATVRAALDGLGTPAVLVGHDYGGAVITEAGTHPAAERLVYIAGFALAEGESFECDPPAPDAELLYGDCAPADVERAVALLRPQRTSQGTPRAAAWRSRPTTYVVCGADRVLPAEVQRELAARIPDVSLVELPGCSHSPFFSRPADLADLLAGLAEEAA